MKSVLLLSALALTTDAYWLMGADDFITTERLDPIVSPGKISSHVHSVVGGSNFRAITNTSFLRESECTSVPIPQDKSNYWFPMGERELQQPHRGSCHKPFRLSDQPGTTKAFPDDFRMLSGNPTMRTYDPTSHAQQAISFLCLDFNGVSTRHAGLPLQACPSGVRAQINFPSCWDGKNVDSDDHKSHVAFLSGGPDSGSCSDPNFPVILPRIFMEVYWNTNQYESLRSQAMNTTQPFVFSYGDRTGFGYHADYINGWDAGVLQNAVDKCHCSEFGDASCCAQQGIFDLNKGKSCRITPSINEQTTGYLLRLPGNNPVQEEGSRATIFPDNSSPSLISPVYAYTGDVAPQIGEVISPPSSVSASASPSFYASVPSTSAMSSMSTTDHSVNSATPHLTVPTPGISAPHSVASPSNAIPSIVVPPAQMPCFGDYYHHHDHHHLHHGNTLSSPTPEAGTLRPSPTASGSNSGISPSGTCRRRSPRADEQRAIRTRRHNLGHRFTKNHVRSF
ncbi:hypothetical protein AX17_005536 [Amanita inopinata Kibby_2008]|nr:hypothetical protein AX17_005536 [Amanita inopinata Kibby_2008]